MKRFLCAILCLGMILGALPEVSFAASLELSASKTAYFSADGKWIQKDGDNILASTNEGGWGAASSFTDADGTILSQPSFSGSNFTNARNALAAFTLPGDFDPDKVSGVTLSLTVKNVKQVSSGARLAIYGNSVDGSWSAETATGALFGANGASSGLSELPLLGLTDAVKTGNATGETASGEVVTLSSYELTQYVCDMAREGKSEITLRIAAPKGGIRVFDSEQGAKAPKLSIEQNDVGRVKILRQYISGGEVVSQEERILTNVAAGETFAVSRPAGAAEMDGVKYVFDIDESNLSTVVEAGKENVVKIIFTRYDESLTFDGYEMDDEAAWCWFADPRSISYTSGDGEIDVTIIGYIDVHGSIKATQINNNTGKVDEVLIRSNIQPDDHNNPTFLVLPDERIMVFYSRHTDERCFWYRVSEKPGDITTLGEEKCLPTSAATTYPSPFILSKDPEHIYLCWRGINWHPTIAKLDIPDENGDTQFVFGPYQTVQSTAARPYVKYASNGEDKIFMSYTTGHPDQEATNWLYFNQINIEDMTLEDINGNTLSKIGEKTLAVNTKDECRSFAIDTSGGVRDWLWQVAVADDGEPIVAMVKINGAKTSHDYYYVKHDNGEWVKTFLTNAGGHFHRSNTELCYSGGMGIDTDEPNVIYCSVPIDGAFGKVYEIVKYTMSPDGRKIEKTEQITKNSEKNNVRPFVIPSSEGKDIRLIWMNGDYYYWMVNKSYKRGYPTAAMSEKELPKEDIDLDGAAFEQSGAVALTTSSAKSVINSLMGEFTVSADISLDGYGKVLDLGEASVSIESRPTIYGMSKPSGGVAAPLWANRPRVVLTVRGEETLSPNVYANSDWWADNASGTNGEYGYTEYGGYVNMTLTYDGESFALYRDGLLDIKVSCENFSSSRAYIGAFDGTAGNIAVYDRVLNHDEIKYLADRSDPKEAGGEIQVTLKYEDMEGSAIAPDERINLSSFSDTVVPENAIIAEDGIYVLRRDYSDLSFERSGDVVTAVYAVQEKVSENLIENGSFEDENGDFSAEGWLDPKSGNEISMDDFYAVTHDKAISEGKETALDTPIPDGGWALGTRRNVGANAAGSLKRQIPVEAGKTYYFAFKVRNKNENEDGTYLKVSFNADGVNIANGDANVDEHNTIDAGVVGTEWKTVEKVFTATEGTDNILIWFRWLGDEKNTGNGPFWMFDNFELYEIEDGNAIEYEMDGEKKFLYTDTLALGERTDEGLVLPENVAGYLVEKPDGGTEFVPAGEIEITGGERITTRKVNISLIDGAQVRVGEGVDESGKVAGGSGLRFIAYVAGGADADKYISYGVEIQAEGSEAVVNIPADKYQNEERSIFTAVLTNLNVSNYNRVYTAKAYMKVSYSDGTEKTFHPEKTVSRSVYRVAAGLLKNGGDGVAKGDTGYDYGVSGEGDALYNVLNAYVNMAGIRLSLDKDGNFTMRGAGAGAYSGDILFEVESEKQAEGVYSVTVSPVSENVSYSAKIMGYWQEFVRINNNHTKAAANISDVKENADGSVTFTFTMPTE